MLTDSKNTEWVDEPSVTEKCRFLMGTQLPTSAVSYQVSHSVLMWLQNLTKFQRGPKRPAWNARKSRLRRINASEKANIIINKIICISTIYYTRKAHLFSYRVVVFFSDLFSKSRSSFCFLFFSLENGCVLFVILALIFHIIQKDFYNMGNVSSI